MNTQRLLDLIKVNEQAIYFDLSEWICGSYGCLLGNYSLSIKDRNVFNFKTKYESVYRQAALYFDIPLKISYFLFSPYNFKRTKTKLMVNGYRCSTFRASRDCYAKDAAINRVRKYVYFKLHQREMELDERGCVREEARLTGSWNLINKVKDSVVASCA